MHHNFWTQGSPIICFSETHPLLTESGESRMVVSKNGLLWIGGREGGAVGKISLSGTPGSLGFELIVSTGFSSSASVSFRRLRGGGEMSLLMEGVPLDDG